MYRCSLLVLVVFLGVANWVRSDDATKKDLEQFQGTWQAIAMHSDGQTASKEELQLTHLVVEGNRFTLTGRTFTVSGTFSIDPTKTPKGIDVVLESPNQERGEAAKLLGIYELKGDKRNSCFALTETERPTKFSPAKGYFGFEWKRN
jgi:uncharacterized protein (TIGR03067 family)